MIVLTKGENSEQIYFTGNLNVSSVPNYYYFKFTNRTTLDEVEMWLEDARFTTRYGTTNVATSLYFNDYPEGFWTYEIYPVAEEDQYPTLPICESGLMYLYPQTEFAPTKYDEQNNTFKVYNGQ